MKDKIKNNLENKPLLSLIQDLKDGRASPKILDKQMRQQIVEFLTLQGQDAPSIAQFLKVCDKTVRRDLSEIREKNSISLDAKFVKVTIGDMVTLNRQHISYLMRLSRSREGSLGEKVQAEYLAHRANMERIQRLQSLGYLPNQPQTFVGNLYHNLEGVNIDKAFGDLEKEILDVEEVTEKCVEVEPDKKKQLGEAKKLIQKISTLKDKGGSHEKLK